MKPWYEEIFENSASVYEAQPFVIGTKGEVDFIEREIGFDKSVKILDIGCGTGRHAIELASRGYNVTGVDLSDSQLQRARQRADSANVAVSFLKADARNLTYDKDFDVVMMICEGAFPLMETDEMNFEILKGAARALKDNGVFIFTTLNGLFPLFYSVRDFINQKKNAEASKSNNFDLMTFRSYSEFEHTDDDGNKKILMCNERYYVPSEILWLLKSISFRKIEIFGVEIGNWSRAVSLTADHFEMLTVARK